MLPKDLSIRITRLETGAERTATYCYESYDPDVDEAYVEAPAPLTLNQCIQASHEFFGVDS